MFNPNKNNPQKIDISKLKNGLSKKQQNKIAYECDLLRKSPDELIHLAPFLFVENTTSANTVVIKNEPEFFEWSPPDENEYYFFGESQ